MLATPCAEVELIFLSPSTVFRRSSSGAVMPISTSSAEAPVHTTRTEITSSSKVGKNCTFMRVMPIVPSTKASSISTLAATLWPARRSSRLTCLIASPRRLRLHATDHLDSEAVDRVRQVGARDQHAVTQRRGLVAGAHQHRQALAVAAFAGAQHRHRLQAAVLDHGRCGPRRAAPRAARRTRPPAAGAPAPH
jgi:hypothetical protein